MTLTTLVRVIHPKNITRRFVRSTSYVGRAYHPDYGWVKWNDCICSEIVDTDRTKPNRILFSSTVSDCIQQI